MSCALKKFSDIFGVAGQGVHRYRILDAALVDYVGTLVFAFIFSKLTKIPLVLSTILMFVAGIILHAVFGVNTSAVKYLGLGCRP
jgi:hypothetical protein